MTHLLPVPAVVPMARLALVVLCALGLGACQGRVSVTDGERPFDAATETMRAEAAQIAARADARLLGPDSTRQAPLVATRDSLRAALTALSGAGQGRQDSLRSEIEGLTNRLRLRVARYDSAGTSAGPAPGSAP